MKKRLLNGLFLGVILTAALIAINWHKMSILAAFFVAFLAISLSMLGQALVDRRQNDGEDN